MRASLDELVSFKAVLGDKQCKFEASPPTDSDAAKALVLAMDATRELAFANAPVNVAEISRIAPKTFSDLTGVSLGDIELRLHSLCDPARDDGTGKKPDATPLDMAVSLYLGVMLDRQLGCKPVAWGKADDAQKVVRFVANYKGWQVVKKVRSDALPKEIVAGCAGIFSSSKAKAPDFLSPDGKYNALADAFLAKYPERKSFSRLQEMLAASVDVAKQIAALANGNELRKLFYYSLFERAGFPCFVSTGQVSGVWPELKIPKPRGNYGGKKKK